MVQGLALPSVVRSLGEGGSSVDSSAIYQAAIIPLHLVTFGIDPIYYYFTAGGTEPCYRLRMHNTKTRSRAVQIGRLVAIIPFLGAMPIHAEEASLDEITASEYFKALKVPALVEVPEWQKHDDAEQIKVAKNEARRIYEILMKDEMPELRVADAKSTHHINGLELHSHNDNGRSVVFRHDSNYRLVFVSIGVSNSSTDFPARPEAKNNPAETFEKVFGHPPTGKIHQRRGQATWKTDWPAEVAYKGDLPNSSMGWDEWKGAIRSWGLTRGAKANLAEQLAGLLKEEPVKITEKQAIAAAYKSALSLGFEIAPKAVIGPKLCYYNPADLPLDRIRWRNKNRPDVDGASAMYGMCVRFGIPDSFASVNVLVDHQTGEVLYVATSQQP